MSPRQMKFSLAILCMNAVLANTPDTSGSLQSRAVQNEDLDFWEREMQFAFRSHATWAPNTETIPNSMPPSRAPVVADMCEIALSVTCTGRDGVDCAFIPPKTTDCDVQLFFLYNVMNIGTDSFDVTFLQVSHGVDSYDYTAVFNPTTLAVGQSGKMRDTKHVNFCSDGNYVTVATVQAKHVEGSACVAMAEYEFDVMEECKIRLDIACNVIDGPHSGEDCRSLKASAESTAGNGTSSCLVDVEYTYELSNIGIADLTITRFESVLDGVPQHLLSAPQQAELVVSPTDVLIAYRNETVDTCRDIQYISTGAVRAESTDGEECGDVADFAFDIVPSEST